MNAANLDQLMVHAAWLRRFARALVRDDDAAEDVAQATMIAAWRHPPPEDVKARPWLARVALNQARDLGRSNSRRDAREVASGGASPADPATPEQMVGDLQLHRALADEVTALDEPYRTTVFLRYYEGLSAADIATREGLPAGTVRWRLKEGLDQIRRRLDSRYGGERKRWMAALAPLVPAVELIPASVGTSVGVVAAISRVTAAVPRWTAVPLLGCATVALIWMLVRRPDETAVRGKADGEQALHAGPRVQPAAPGVRRALPRFSASAAAPAPAVAGAQAEAPRLENPEALLHQLLAATEANSYEDFLTHADDMMKAVMGKDDFERAVAQLAPLLKRGFEAEPLGQLRRADGEVVHLWKLVFNGAEEEDSLALLAVKDGRVAGFLIQ